MADNIYCGIDIGPITRPGHPTLIGEEVAELHPSYLTIPWGTWRALLDAIEEAFPADCREDDMTLDGDGTIRVSGHLRWGWGEYDGDRAEGLARKLREWGIPYDGYMAPDYGEMGTVWTWRPGMDKPHKRECDNCADPMIGRVEVERLIREHAGDAEAILAAIRSGLAIDIPTRVDHQDKWRRERGQRHHMAEVYAQKGPRGWRRVKPHANPYAGREVATV